MKSTLLAACILVALAGTASAQSVTPLVNQPPDGASSVALLMTDGTVMAQGNLENDWYRLTPDATGSYVNGTWTRRANMPIGYKPYAFASAVLADGRLVVAGGEYNRDQFELTNKGAIYDPKTNLWTNLAPPPGWSTIGDSPSVVLPDGSFLVGQKLTQAMARLDPKTLTWQTLASTGKNHFNSEEGWTLLPSGTFVTADVKTAPHAELYNPTTQRWIQTQTTIVDLHSPTDVTGCIAYPGGCYFPPGEIGPQILRPDGTVFVAGGIPAGETTAHTAVYHPSTHAWTVGPDFPNGDDAGDESAVLLPSGNVLVAGNSGSLYEFDGTSLKPTASGVGFPMLMLPSGQALLVGNTVGVYTPAGQPQSAWKPRITSFPATVTHGQSYVISGVRFNGMSQAAGFGDELETATNYPLVRITNPLSGHVVYARTHDHSTMGVATGNTTVSTTFDVPSTTERGPARLEVVANGIASAPVNVTVN